MIMSACLSCAFVGLWKMLEENVRVALMIRESLRDQTIQMGLYEMENLLNRLAVKNRFFSKCVKEHLTSDSSHHRFREALVESGKEHRRDPTNHKHKFYLHYLLASISNCIILKWDMWWMSTDKAFFNTLIAAENRPYLNPLCPMPWM